MLAIDVFNGDADGICALHQLRLADPRPAAQLVTGVKRDIQLLASLTAQQDAEITVLDISLDRNREALLSLLAAGNRVCYVDHHYSGDVPVDTHLEAHLNPDPLICTSLIVDQLLAGKYRSWAVVGAFGDNLDQVAEEVAQPLGLSAIELERLASLGRLLNYNGYGESLADLYVTPADLYQEVSLYLDPLQLAASSKMIVSLGQVYEADMAEVTAAEVVFEEKSGTIFKLPDAAWARRVSGVYANQLATENPTKAHGMLSLNGDGSYRVSVRAPLSARVGADQLCRAFPGGGGRAAAAGINRLAATALSTFCQAFQRQFSAIHEE